MGILKAWSLPSVSQTYKAEKQCLQQIPLGKQGVLVLKQSESLCTLQTKSRKIERSQMLRYEAGHEDPTVCMNSGWKGGLQNSKPRYGLIMKKVGGQWNTVCVCKGLWHRRAKKKGKKTEKGRWGGRYRKELRKEEGNAIKLVCEGLARSGSTGWPFLKMSPATP